MTTQDKQLQAIVGEPVSGIAFVQDYVEIHCDGRVLRALTDPAVIIGGESHQFPEPGSRDALCSLIGKVVEKVDIDDSRIQVEFVDGAVLVVPLDANSRVGPEAAHYVPGIDQPIAVW